MIGITGGSGYIGSHLAREFIKRDEKVRIIDIAPPPRDLVDKYFYADINDESGIFRGIEGCDTVYHLAAVVSKLRGFEDRRYCIQTNILGTLNVLEACVKLDVERLIYMGTSEVLGEPLYNPTDENHPRRPKTTYGITKCASEDLCYEYHVTYGLSAVLPRLYMVYGTNDIRPIRYHNVIVKFIWNTLHDKPPIAYKGCIRSFLFITDCVEALTLLKDKGKAGEIYDICADPKEAISTEDLAKLVIRLCGKNFEPIIQEPPSTDTKVKLPSGKKARSELGWSPKISLNEGLKRVVEEWKKYAAEGLPAK